MRDWFTSLKMSAHHVDLPEQVVTPGEELWVKIIDLDLQRRRISLSIKQAAEGGQVAAEYQEHFGDHAYDDEGNYIGGDEGSEGQQAWEEYYAEAGDHAVAGVIETDEDGTEYEYVEVTEEVEVTDDGEVAEVEGAETGAVEAGEVEDNEVEPAQDTVGEDEYVKAD